MQLYAGCFLNATYGDGGLESDIAQVIGTDLELTISALKGLENYYPLQVAEITDSEVAVVYRCGERHSGESRARVAKLSGRGRYLVFTGQTYGTCAFADLVERLDIAEEHMVREYLAALAPDEDHEAVALDTRTGTPYTPLGKAESSALLAWS